MAADASASIRNIASHAQSIGTVTAAAGVVKAFDENGIERILQAGDLVYPNDTIETEANAGVIIQFDAGGFVDLPPSTDLVLNDEIYEAAKQVAEDESLRVQRAIEAGEDPSVAAAAAATGERVDEGATAPLVIGFSDTQATIESGGVQTAALVEPAPPPVPSANLVNATAAVLGLLGPNVPPVDAGERISTFVNTNVSGNVLANATDANHDPLRVLQFTVGGTVHAVGQVADIAGVGSLVIQGDGNFVFTPVTNFVGNMPEVTYVVSDNHGGSTSSTLDIAVTQPTAALFTVTEAGLQSLASLEGAGATKIDLNANAISTTTTNNASASAAEVLKIGDLLEGMGPSRVAEGGYLKFNYDEASGNTRITIDSSGTKTGAVSQVFVLENVDLTAHNTLSTSTIIQNLLHDNHVKTEA